MRRLALVLCVMLVASSGCATLKTATDSQAVVSASVDPAQPLATLSPEKTSQLQIDTADRLANAGHASEAIELYLTAEQADPDSSKFDSRLAPLFAQVEQFEKSIDRYRRAIQQQPQNIDLRINYAWTLMEAGRLTDAEAELRSVISTAPQQQRALDSLAVCLFRGGNVNAAWRQFEATHGAASASHNIAVLYLESGDRSEAERWLGDAMSRNPLPATQRLLASLTSQQPTPFRSR